MCVCVREWLSRARGALPEDLLLLPLGDGCVCGGIGVCGHPAVGVVTGVESSSDAYLAPGVIGIN